MSTAPIEPGIAAGARLLPGWAPLHEWSRRRRAAVAALVAAAAFISTMLACATRDFAGYAAADAARAAARRELADAQYAQRALPALKREAAAHARAAPGNSADDARNVSELAAATGIALVSLEPGASGGRGDEAFRALKLAAYADFAPLRAFLRGLAQIPALTVPTDVAIRRSGSQLSLSVTLSVFDALPSPAEVPASRAGADPFAPASSDGFGPAGALRLAGLMRDATHALALIETPSGTEAVGRGERIDGAQVTQIATRQVTLAAGGTTRVLAWTEDER